MFLIKKIISSFILPAGFLIVIFWIFSFLFWKKREKKLSYFFLFFSFFLWLITTDFLAINLKCILERDYLKNSKLDGDVIIVLGGGIKGGYEKNNNFVLTEFSIERLLTAYFLHRKLKLPIIVTGGSVYGYPAESEIAKKFLISLGVSENYIYPETNSRDTYENALFSRKICKAKKFQKPIIVTDAWHMKRSIFLFKKAGFDEVSYAVSSFSCSNKKSFMDFLPGDFREIKEFFHEVIGFYFYKFFY